MDRDIFLVFRQMFDEDDERIGMPQVMGGFYSQDNAKKEADKIFRESIRDILGNYIQTWVERTKIRR